MAKVLGVGGLFFKSPDPERLLAWYAKWLGIGDGKSSVEFPANALPAHGLTVWSPFPANTHYFAPSRKEFMFHLVLDDLESALGQGHLGGAPAVGEVEVPDHGPF